MHRFQLIDQKQNSKGEGIFLGGGGSGGFGNNFNILKENKIPGYKDNVFSSIEIKLKIFSRTHVKVIRKPFREILHRLS